MSQAYASINKDETRLLDQLPFEERWLYIKLKWLANFNTGKIAKFGKRVLTYQKIGEMIAVPAAQGRMAKPISGGEIKRMIDRLESAGLVADHAYDTGAGITLTLPLSLIRKPASAGKLQTNVQSQSPANTDGTTHCDEQQHSQSVMMSSGHNNTFFSNDGAGDTPAPRHPPGGSPPPSSPKKEEEADAGAGLSIPRIRALLDESWLDFHYLDTAETQRFFANWIKRGCSVAEIESAISKVLLGNETPTAGALDRHIQTARNPNGRRPKKPASRGGLKL